MYKSVYKVDVFEVREGHLKIAPLNEDSDVEV